MNDSRVSTEDLNHIIKHTALLWEPIRNQSIFLSGGTGFFGCWLLESFIWANEKLNLNAHALVLTRNKAAFEKKCPHLAFHPALQWLEGDVRDFPFPKKSFAAIIHAATEASVTLNKKNPSLMLDTIIQGTKHMLEFAKACDAKYFLLTSSGAVYGKQPSNMTHVSEDYFPSFKPTDSNSAYALGKYVSEHVCHLFATQTSLQIKIARCFAFLGPYFPLDAHYAIGNFIRDGLNGRSIIIEGDGTPERSYLYAADLMIWLWTILFRGQPLHPYNVGSDEALTISEIAHLVANSFDPPIEVNIVKTAIPGVQPERYVPNIQRARTELSLAPLISVVSAIESTKRWHLG